MLKILALVDLATPLVTMVTVNVDINTVIELVICQKYSISSIGVSVYSAAEQTFNKDVNLCTQIK